MITHRYHNWGEYKIWSTVHTCSHDYILPFSLDLFYYLSKVWTSRSVSILGLLSKFMKILLEALNVHYRQTSSKNCLMSIPFLRLAIQGWKWQRERGVDHGPTCTTWVNQGVISPWVDRQTEGDREEGSLEDGLTHFPVGSIYNYDLRSVYTDCTLV